MATDYIREIQMLQTKGPYFIVGECLGGPLAFEIAQQLRAKGEAMALLLLMDCFCPCRRDYIQYRLREALATFRKTFLARLLYHVWQLPSVQSGKRLDYFKRNCIKAGSRIHSLLGSQPLEAPGALSAIISQYEIRRRHYRKTLYRYRPRPYPGPMTMIVNSDWYDSARTLGWERFVREGLQVHKVPGNHLSYIREDVQTTAQRLLQCLANAQADQTADQNAPLPSLKR
jgi:thioesterase domain-containing protein